MRLSFSEKLLSVHELVLDDATLAMIASKHHDEARENAQSIESVRFEFMASGGRYDGFYARLRDLDPGKRHPVIIVNRGGSNLIGIVGAKQVFFGTVTALVRAGYIVIGSQCLGLGTGGASDRWCGEDFASVLTLKEFIDADDRADASRIGAYGASRGAIATYRLLAETDWVRAASVVSGIVDLLETDFRPEMVTHYEKMFGGSREEREKRSAICWPERLRRNAPILLLYGTSDWRVNPRSGLRFAEKLIDQGVPHRLVLFEGGNHALSEHWQESRDLSLAWFDRFVRRDEVLPDMAPHGK